MAWQMYDWLLARADANHALRGMLLGLQWSVAELDGFGLCFSPVDAPRTLPWSGTLIGRPARELFDWIRSFDAAEACVGAATLNAAINGPANAALRRAQPLAAEGPGHLRVFAHFAPRLSGAKVVVVGRYPGLEQTFAGLDYVCLERRAGADTLSDLASEYILPEADWVFLTASAIANKSLPRLLELSRRARVVLMGPSLPWLAEWADFGVDYLAGVVVRDADQLLRVAAEGGGTRIFDGAVEYRLLGVS
jgi:uncharacterized protein (DUF4213/DUF364 family)